jgi:hypothetical protein
LEKAMVIDEPDKENVPEEYTAHPGWKGRSKVISCGVFFEKKPYTVALAAWHKII